MGKPRDLTGHEYGLLRAEAWLGSDARGNAVWLCRCVRCGRPVAEYAARLLRAVRQDTGCACGPTGAIRGAVPAAPAPTGLWTPLAPARRVPGPHSRHRYWWCRCNGCRVLYRVRASHLTAGASGGCVSCAQSGGPPC